MKKFLVYSLIFIALIFAAPSSFLGAETLGTCTVTNITATPPDVRVTRNVPHYPNCDEANAIPGALEIKWEANSSAAAQTQVCTLKSTTTGNPAVYPKIKNEEDCRQYAKDFGYIFVSFGPPASPPSTKSPDANNATYELLSPLPCPPGSTDCTPGEGKLLETYTINAENPISGYLNILIKIFIGICSVLAVIMIIVGGLEYMTTELVSTKESAKSRITNAIFGLILALGAWTILYQINPRLLDADLKSLETVEVSVELEPEKGVASETISTVGGRQLKACDESQITSISLFGSNVRVHKGVASSLIRINAKWSNMPNRYKVNSVAGYNCRKVAGTNTYSAHAFGVALDINPSTNPYGKNAKTDMPSSFVQLFTSEGWGWGGNWSSVKDAMHFSKFPPSEGGNGVIEI